MRAVACRGDLLASGGADEIVKLYDLRRRVESGQLMDHQGKDTDRTPMTAVWAPLKRKQL